MLEEELGDRIDVYFLQSTSPEPDGVLFQLLEVISHHMDGVLLPKYTNVSFFFGWIFATFSFVQIDMFAKTEFEVELNIKLNLPSNPFGMSFNTPVSWKVQNTIDFN